MKTKHAPGPWWVSDNNSDQRPEAIHCHGSNTILAVTANHFPEDVRKANAALIAAAPELLAACKAALNCCALNLDDLEDSDRDAIGLLQAAIARAEGSPA